MKNQDISRSIHILSRQIKRNVDEAVSRYNVTSVQCALIKLISEESKKGDVYAKDIENRFDMRRATVAEVLSLMEKNKLIERKAIEKDARLKKIILTNKSLEIKNKVDKEIKKVEGKMKQNLSNEEIEEFIRLINKMSSNLIE